MLPLSRRQERLERIWGFKCDCHFCSKPDARPNENLLSEAVGKWDSARVSTMNTLYTKCEEAAKSYQSPSEGVEAIKLFIEFLQLGLGLHHWRNIQVRNWYIEAAISVADFIPRAAKDLPKILSHQILSEELFLPRLHLDRLPVRYFNIRFSLFHESECALSPWCIVAAIGGGLPQRLPGASAVGERDARAHRRGE
jgi:hypothetical protein